MSQIQFTVDAENISGYLQGRSDEITAALMERTTAINSALQAKIAGQKLAGEVLHQRTGKGAASVRIIPTVNSGSNISGGVQAGGGVAWYLKLHEFGGTFTRKAGTVKLRVDAKSELLRQLKDGGKTNLAVFAKSSHKRIKEVAYDAGTVTFPVRSFMRSTLAEERENIITQLQAAVKEGGA